MQLKLLGVFHEVTNNMYRSHFAFAGVDLSFLYIIGQIVNLYI